MLRQWLAAALVLPVAAVDGQSFKASDEEADRIWNDPNCERTANATEGIDWDVTRHWVFV